MVSNRAGELERLLRERIVILDGAMGTMIQQRKLGEADFRGDRFRDWRGKDLKGNNDLLNVTQPGLIEAIHARSRQGVTFFTMLFGDFNQPETLDLFAEKVAPAFA